jgi:hypothetical protein
MAKPKYKKYRVDSTGKPVSECKCSEGRECKPEVKELELKMLPAQEISKKKKK